MENHRFDAAQVPTANVPLDMSGDAVVAVNTLGLGSAVGHTVLQANPRPPQAPQDPTQHLPRLLTVSGRSEECVAGVVKKARIYDGWCGARAVYLLW